MKIIHINSVNRFGSTGRICSELIEYFNKLGHKSCLFYGNKSYDDDNSFRFNSDLTVKIHGLLSRVFGKQTVFSTWCTKKMIIKMKEIKPDIVHLHNLHGNYINLNVLLKYLSKENIATVVTLHDCWFYTGKCTHYTEQKCSKWKTGCYDCAKLKADNPSWFFDKTSEMWKEKKELFSKIPRLAVIGVSDWITNEARQSFLKNASIIKRIYNWIDTDMFYPRNTDITEKYHIPKNKFNILLVGSGWNYLSVKFQDAMSLSEKVGDDVNILLVGKIDDSIKLPKNIIKLGHIDSLDELAEIYSFADVYVHLSHEDTFGKVIAEALACGTPAIVYNSTACPEIVVKGCGYVVDVGNVEQIVEKIYELKNNLKVSYSENCRKWVLDNYDKEMLLNDTYDLYKELIKI